MTSASKNPFRPNYAVPPGETLKETLEFLGMTPSQLADRAGRPRKAIYDIVSGKSSITAETALQFERVLGVPASFWNNLQCNYEGTLARLSEEKELSSQVEWAKKFPVNSMIKLEWIPKEDSKVRQLQALLSFFGVAGIEEWETLWQSPDAAYRKSPAFKSNPFAIGAWLRRGEILGSRIQCDPFDSSTFIESLKQIRSLTTEPPKIFEPSIKQLCARSGVAVTFVPELPGTCLFGSTRWLNPGKALVQLSLRGKSDDLLWFTFFHEAGHILLHGKKDVFIEAKGEGCLNRDSDHEEDQANAFSRDWLIPKQDYSAFVAQGNYDLASIRRLAKQVGIAPGIVVGRLQHEGLIPFSHGSGLKQRFMFKQ